MGGRQGGREGGGEGRWAHPDYCSSTPCTAANGRYGVAMRVFASECTGAWTRGTWLCCTGTWRNPRIARLLAQVVALLLKGGGVATTLAPVSQHTLLAARLRSRPRHTTHPPTTPHLRLCPGWLCAGRMHALSTAYPQTEIMRRQMNPMAMAGGNPMGFDADAAFKTEKQALNAVRARRLGWLVFGGCVRRLGA